MQNIIIYITIQYYHFIILFLIFNLLCEAH